MYTVTMAAQASGDQYDQCVNAGDVCFKVQVPVEVNGWREMVIEERVRVEQVLKPLMESYEISAGDFRLSRVDGKKLAEARLRRLRDNSEPMLMWEEVGPLSALYAKLYRPDVAVIYLKPGAKVTKLGTWLEPAGTGPSKDTPPAPLAKPTSNSN